MKLDDIEFVILCPERNMGGLRSTVCSAKTSYPNKTTICVVGDDATDTEIKEFSNYCPVIKAGKTHSSLLNTGIKACKSEWIMIYMAGMRVRTGVLTRYEHFCKSKKHIMYPVVSRKWKFDEASINGLLIHKDALKECGDLSEEYNEFSDVKLFWAAEAIAHDYEFRALVGIPR